MLIFNCNTIISNEKIICRLIKMHLLCTLPFGLMNIIQIILIQQENIVCGNNSADTCMRTCLLCFCDFSIILGCLVAANAFVHSWQRTWEDHLMYILTWPPFVHLQSIIDVIKLSLYLICHPF